MKHLCVIWKALCFMWGVKSIVWGPDRIRLWRKSVNLYLSFLAFTDKERLSNQLEKAMACAIVSAVYDYDTDYEFGNRQGHNFCLVLEQLIVSVVARERATKLFEIDTKQQLTLDGLERGGEALHFYRLVIDAKWMRTYSDVEIDRFGRNLQMIDDLLDLDDDRLAGDQNCFLVAEDLRQYVEETRIFLDSDFFCLLQERSGIYRTIKSKAISSLRRFGGTVSFRQLFATGRPHTGLYALLLSVASFGLFDWSDWPLGLFAGVVFGLLTMSIMTFNDYIDCHHDVQKGKTFARDHRENVLSFWLWEALTILCLLAILAYFAFYVALFCLGVWFIGLGYSFMHRWFLVQNILVALCSGSPALCGMVYAGVWHEESLLTFVLFVCLILFSEINKDIEDRRIDQGYKDTVPVRWGSLRASFLLIMGVHLVALPIIFHPNPWILTIGLLALPNLSFQQACALLRPRRVKRPIDAVELTIKMLGVVLYLT